MGQLLKAGLPHPETYKLVAAALWEQAGLLGCDTGLATARLQIVSVNAPGLQKEISGLDRIRRGLEEIRAKLVAILGDEVASDTIEFDCIDEEIDRRSAMLRRVQAELHYWRGRQYPMHGKSIRPDLIRLIVFLVNRLKAIDTRLLPTHLRGTWHSGRSRNVSPYRVAAHYLSVFGLRQLNAPPPASPKPWTITTRRNQDGSRTEVVYSRSAVQEHFKHWAQRLKDLPPTLFQ